MSTKEQRSILKHIFMEQSTLKCLACDKVIGNAYGLLRHMEQCNLTLEVSLESSKLFFFVLGNDTFPLVFKLKKTIIPKWLTLNNQWYGWKA